MTENEFQNRELQFIEDFTSSPIYKRTSSLSEAISSDKRLVSLSKERDELYLKATECQDEEEKERILIQMKEKQDLFLNDEKVREYLTGYRKLKDIISYLNEQLIKELKA